jgi:hypothetical protein
MKKILKILLPIFVITIIATGCKKDEKHSIVGTWKPENITMELAFNSSINPIVQGMIQTFLSEMMNEGNFLEITEETLFEFRKDGKVIITDEEGQTEATYTTAGNILTITTLSPPSSEYAGIYNTLSGNYSVSKSQLHWTVSIDPQEIFDGVEELLDNENLGPFGDLIVDAIKGITSISYKTIFARQ